MKVPDHYFDSQEFPNPEDIILEAMREAIPDIPIVTRIPDKRNPFPLILLRGSSNQLMQTTDHRFVERAVVEFHVYTEAPDAEPQGQAVSAAIKRAMYALAEPGAHPIIRNVVMTQGASRTPDWATSTGPVQYADLPTGVERFESIYRLTYRKPGT